MRVQAAQLIVQHVREPSQGMPVAGVAGIERVFHSLPSQAAVDPLVVHDIVRVIKVDEIIPEDWVIRHRDAGDQRQTDSQEQPPIPGVELIVIMVGVRWFPAH